MTLLFITTLIALALSLLMQAKQFFAKLELVKHRDDLLVRFRMGRSGRVQEATEQQLRDFDAALQDYRGVLPQTDDMTAVARRVLLEDLRVLSNIGGYPEAAGWGHAFAVVSSIRARLIVAQFAIAPSASAPVKKSIDQLLALLRGWATVAAFYDDFTQPRAFKSPDEVTQEHRPDLSLAQEVAKETQEAAQELLVHIENVGHGAEAGL